MRYAAFTPHVVTDCKSLLTTAAAGDSAATRAGSPMAGIWSDIVTAVDGGIERLVTDHLLRWMPSHLSAATFASACLFDGCSVSVTDWRANRLADAIAKRCAARFLVDPRLRKRGEQGVRGATEMRLGVIRTEAAVLGAVTFAANKHKVTEVQDGGRVVVRTLRDADRHNQRPQDVAARPWRKRVAEEPAPPAEVRGVERNAGRGHERTAGNSVGAEARKKVRREAKAWQDFITRDALARKDEDRERVASRGQSDVRSAVAYLLEAVNASDSHIAVGSTHGSDGGVARRHQLLARSGVGVGRHPAYTSSC